MDETGCIKAAVIDHPSSVLQSVCNSGEADMTDSFTLCQVIQFRSTSLEKFVTVDQ